VVGTAAAPALPLRGERLHEAIQARIKQYILDSRLKPGDPLPTEMELSRELGIGRNSLRESVKSLQALGVVETRHGSGMFVGQLSLTSLANGLAFHLALDGQNDLRAVRQLLEIREVLEAGLIVRVVDRLSAEDLAELERLVREMERRAARGRDFGEADRAFHERLYRPLGNQLALELIGAFWDGFYAVRARLPARPRPLTDTAANHRRILEHVAAGDGPGAARALVHDLRGNQLWVTLPTEAE